MRPTFGAGLQNYLNEPNTLDHAAPHPRRHRRRARRVGAAHHRRPRGRPRSARPARAGCASRSPIGCAAPAARSALGPDHGRGELSVPIRPPALDDRSFNDLVDELVARIPAHTPEWTNPRLGDPGRTLIELFAWLDRHAALSRQPDSRAAAPGVPAAAGLPMSPAVAGHRHGRDQLRRQARTRGAGRCSAHATVKGPVPFETTTEITVLPVGERPITSAR